MGYQMLVRNLFNDMYLFFNGKEPIGLEVLSETYQDEPLFISFIGNLDEALKVPYNDAMQECYGFYKQYTGRPLTDEEWENVVNDVKGFSKKWDNAWCKNIILALFGLLEAENDDMKAVLEENLSGEEDSVNDELSDNEAQEFDIAA
ncbi:MAG: hypothetical protein ACLUFH_00340 [Monoglobales bacterium]